MHISLLAHQGGWDEALFVIGPLLFIVWVLHIAKRRAERTRSDDAGAAGAADDAGAVGPDGPTGP